VGHNLFTVVEERLDGRLFGDQRRYKEMKDTQASTAIVSVLTAAFTTIGASPDCGGHPAVLMKNAATGQ
jgi:hypothetical protein